MFVEAGPEPGVGTGLAGDPRGLLKLPVYGTAQDGEGETLWPVTMPTGQRPHPSICQAVVNYAEGQGTVGASGPAFRSCPLRFAE